MTKRDARKYVFHILAHTLQHDFDNDSNWLNSPDAGKTEFSDADRERIRREAELIMRALRAKGEPSRG